MTSPCIGVRADDIDSTIGNGNDDAFAWVPLVDLAAGTEIFFTDMLLEFSREGSGNYTFTPSG